MRRYPNRYGQWIVGPVAGALTGFVVTWCVVAFILRLGMVNDTRTALTALIASSTAIALLVAARARRNGKSS
jgi:hypothetical protein